MRLHPTDERQLPALVIAVLVDSGFMTLFPHEWTRIGVRSIRRHSHGRNFNLWGVFDEAVAALVRAGFTGPISHIK